MEIGATARPPPIMFQEGAGSGTAIHVSFDESIISALQLAEPVKSGSTKEVWMNVLVSHCLFEGKTWVLKKPKSEAANGVQLDGAALLRSELYIREIVCAVCDAWNIENDKSSHFIAPRMILMTLSGCLSSVMKNMEELSKVWVFEEQVVGPLEKVITNVGEVNDMLQDDYPEFAHSVIEEAEAFIHKSYAVLEGKALILDVELLMTTSGPRYILDCQICFWGKFNHDFQRFYGYGNSGEQGYRAFVKTHRICVETTVFQRIPLHVAAPIVPPNPSVPPKTSIPSNPSIVLPVGEAPIVLSPIDRAVITPAPIVEDPHLFENILDDPWEGVGLCKNAYALVCRDGCYEPGFIVNHYANEPFPFEIVAATGRPPLSQSRKVVFSSRV
ncbi:hypothetical protein BDR26DRAFT_561151 [Obelidium mucronatum]|nr:hypothetical protein BDR26DRAFT_561151 [Obelidium mucronatum]